MLSGPADGPADRGIGRSVSSGDLWPVVPQWPFKSGFHCCLPTPSRPITTAGVSLSYIPIHLPKRSTVFHHFNTTLKSDHWRINYFTPFLKNVLNIFLYFYIFFTYKLNIFPVPCRIRRIRHQTLHLMIHMFFYKLLLFNHYYYYVFHCQCWQHNV